MKRFSELSAIRKIGAVLFSIGAVGDAINAIHPSAPIGSTVAQTRTDLIIGAVVCAMIVLLIIRRWSSKRQPQPIQEVFTGRNRKFITNNRAHEARYIQNNQPRNPLPSRPSTTSQFRGQTDSIYRDQYVLDHQTTTTISKPTWVPPDDYANNKAGESARRKAEEVLNEGGDPKWWIKGAEGEELVGKYLEELNDKWRVLHSVTIFESGADIDHVVIGPPGVFVLNTKNHSGGKVSIYDQAIYVSREKQPYIKASESEAKTAHRALSDACDFQVFVTPVIVLIADIVDIKRVPNTVRVVESGDIVSWLRNHPRILTDEEVESIYAKARLSETWLS